MEILSTSPLDFAQGRFRGDTFVTKSIQKSWDIQTRLATMMSGDFKISLNSESPQTPAATMQIKKFLNEVDLDYILKLKSAPQGCDALE